MIDRTEYDCRRVLDFEDKIYLASENPSDLARQVLIALADLVYSEITSFNLINFEERRGYYIVLPEAAYCKALREVFNRFMHQHPLLKKMAEEGAQGPMKFSDIITLEELEKLPLYQEHFRPLKVRYQIGFKFGEVDGMAMACGLNRLKNDFSETERFLLSRQRQFLDMVYRNIKLASEANTGYIFVDGSTLVPTHHATCLLEEYAGDSQKKFHRFKAELSDWAQSQIREHGRTDRLGHLPRPHFIRGKNGLLQASISKKSERWYITLREKRDCNEGLQGSRFTPAQLRVMEGITAGLTSKEIGYELTIEPESVDKHVEDINKTIFGPEKSVRNDRIKLAAQIRHLFDKRRQ